MVLASAVAGAADSYFIPLVEAGAEYHSNRFLRPTGLEDDGAEGYTAGLGGVFGLRSQRGRTEARPRLEFEEYPDQEELKRTSQYFDLRSDYRWIRSQFNFIGRYSRENEYDAQISQAGFDDFDPNNPIDDTNGRLELVSQTVTRAQLRPGFTYKFSPRVGAGVSAVYQTVNFDADAGSTRTDYDYSQVQGFLTWTLDPKSELKTGVYGSRFETDDDSNKTDSKGVSFDLEHRWSETFTGIVGIDLDRSDIERVNRPKETSDGWGFNVGAERSTQVSRLRFTLGRDFNPSTGGSRTQVDNGRVEYERDITARWAVNAAGRYLRTRAQGGADEDDREFARVDLGVMRRMTQTWFIGAGYSYVWQEYRVDGENGDDNVFLVRVGYQGLAPPAR